MCMHMYVYYVYNIIIIIIFSFTYFLLRKVMEQQIFDGHDLTQSHIQLDLT